MENERKHMCWCVLWGGGGGGGLGGFDYYTETLFKYSWTRSLYLYHVSPETWVVNCMLTYFLLVLGDYTSLCILEERRKFKKCDRGKIGQPYNVCI